MPHRHIILHIIHVIRHVDYINPWSRDWLQVLPDVTRSHSTITENVGSFTKLSTRVSRGPSVLNVVSFKLIYIIKIL